MKRSLRNSFETCVKITVGSTVVSKKTCIQCVLFSPRISISTANRALHHSVCFPFNVRHKTLLTLSRLAICVAWALGRPLDFLFDPFECVVRLHYLPIERTDDK